MPKKIKLSENAQKVAETRYFIEGEDWEGCSRRVANAVAEVEKDQAQYASKFFDMIYNMDFIPGGRILRNSGRAKGSMLNCYVVPIGDSIEEIGKYMADSLVLWSNGGGVGTNFSPLRPKGDRILGKGGASSGLVSFMKAANAVSQTIESGGQRRAAALGCVDVSHPEIVDFINAKLVDGEISHFNISVLVNDDFLKAVERDDKWTFKFKQKEYGSMPAKDIWKLIVTNMINCAEPGILNNSNLSKNNSYYYDPVLATNPCGEIPLEAYGVCCLGSLVLPNFITGTTNTNWKKLEQTIKLSIRFLDNVLDVNKYSLKESDIKAHNSRRIGLGIMGLAEYLFAKEARYGSEKAIFEIERLMRFIRDTTYETGVELAEEKGAFPKFDPIQYGNSSFVRKLPTELRLKIKEKGIRNVTYLTCPPSGTTSLLPEVSSGIEPLIYKSYKRVDRVGERIYVHPKYKQFLLSGEKVPDWFVDIGDLSAIDHFETQKIIQKYIDNSVSKTINLPYGTTYEELNKLLLEYIYDLKGVTVYVEGAKQGQIYTRLSEQETMDYILNSELEIKNELDDEDKDCGLCEKKDEKKEKEDDPV
jgi:ribonucleoside-diphosphate reductase alpha chain